MQIRASRASFGALRRRIAAARWRRTASQSDMKAIDCMQPSPPDISGHQFRRTFQDINVEVAQQE
jgi:hypothetical protein